jgi:glutamate synthase (NADPH/NADH) small chain
VADPTGFLKYGRENPVRRPVDVRIQDWKEVYEPFAPEALRTQAARCMDCGIPFCHNGCPLGNLIPEWNDQVRRDEWWTAHERLHATNNFPEFTGRLCPAPCESASVLGISDDPVAIKQVELEIVEHGFAEGWVTPQLALAKTGRRVAVVGSGPAGLACAQQLTRAGHEVTVLERADRVGGLMRYGIPEFKMEKAVLDRRLEQMVEEGTLFRTSVDVGVDVTVDQLRADYDAVVLAGGSTVGRTLPVEGADLAGVHLAMSYLEPANRVQAGDLDQVPLELDAAGLDVVIIGGGDTGADCLGTAHRQGARSVTQLEIMVRPPDVRADSTPWPLWPLMFRSGSAHEEGGERLFAVSTKKLVADDRGRVAGLVLEEVTADGGRFVPVEGSERTLPAQLVLLAMGFTGPQRTGLLEGLGVELDGRGNVARDSQFRTSADDVFVCGDMGRGQSLIVWAIAEGRSAAAAVDVALAGETLLPAPLVAAATR